MEIVILAVAYPVAIALLFYFAFLRPVQQQQRRLRRELAQLQVGDQVLTQAGFIATVKEIIVPEEGGLTEIVLELASPDQGRGSLEVRAVASAIVQRLTPESRPSPHGAGVAGRGTGDSGAQ